ncbi:ATP-binding cassette domain-containing protein [Streptomyces sp. B6B3]|uniref:ATP-binding cassette domain-containing protein n=1 Tax=Streptomyces sp. B6B3 TaxID=3153570 RepID=UPI00325F6834
MIEAEALTKRYGARTAVDGLTFTVRPGLVTGFLGPNGAGKSTTMRLILGLDAPTSGRVTVRGRRYADHPAPLAELGSLLEAKAVHTGRSAAKHLLALAHTHRIPRRRVAEVVEMVGLAEVAGKRVGGFSLGMGQRLGLAAALLGDPAVVMLDEPVNGLDPEGVRWIRGLLRGLAAEGRTVFLSSHLMSEMAQTADHLVIIGQGRLLADTGVPELLRAAGVGTLRVVTPEAARLRRLLAGPDVTIAGPAPDTLEITGLDAPRVGLTAAEHGIPLFELTPGQTSLEDAYLDLTRDTVEYQTSTGGGAR